MAHAIVTRLLGLAILLAASPQASAQQATHVSPSVVDAYVRNTWKSPADGWASRVEQDETQRICSETRNAPTKTQSAQIETRERAAIVFPVDGKVLGDWKAGEVVAQTGTGGQFSDKPDTRRGGNCYACHQLAPKELSYGTLGPSLAGYGKIRKFDPAEAKAAFGKIFDAQSVTPCSNMPRFGYHKFLSEQQIKDVTAYLFDPESPVNKP